MSTFQTIGRRTWLIAGLLWSPAGVLGAEVPGRLPPVPAPLGVGTWPDLNGPPAVRMAQAERPGGGLDRPSGRSEAEPLLPPAGSILDPNVRPIDLNTALRLAGVQNPELLIARQRVVEAAALRQLAAAQFLPTHQPGHELRHAHRRPPAVQRQHPLGQPQRPLRRGGCERDRGGHGEHPRRGPEREHRRGGLRLPGVAAGRARARVRQPGDPQPGVPADHAGLLRAAPRRGARGPSRCRSATRRAVVAG